jgi:hypothetical protein
VEEREPLAKNLRLVVRLDSKTLPRIQAPAQTLLKLTQNGFDHYKAPDRGYSFHFKAKQSPAALLLLMLEAVHTDLVSPSA